MVTNKGVECIVSENIKYCKQRDVGSSNVSWSHTKKNCADLN